MRNKWHSDEIAFLKAHLEDKTCPELAKELGRTTSSISRKLTELELLKGRKAKAKDVWTEEEIATLHEFWDKVALQELATKVDRSVLATKRKKNLLGLNKRALVNQSFFEEETAEKYYILGYIFADGSLYQGISTNGNPVYSFSIDSIDVNELQLILSKIAPGRNVYVSKKDEEGIPKLWQLKLTNQRLYRGLIKYGLHPNKSYTIQFPNIPDCFLGEFLRGYFDGDGWFGYVSSTDRWKLGFTSGSKPFLERLRDRVCDYLKLTSANTVQKFNLTFSKKQDVFRISRLLYGNMQCDLYLHRKYTSYQEVCQWCKQIGATE